MVIYEAVYTEMGYEQSIPLWLEQRCIADHMKSSSSRTSSYASVSTLLTVFAAPSLGLFAGWEILP